MNHRLSFLGTGSTSENTRCFESSSRADFQSRFTAALTRCVKHGFTVEEAFGIIWEETLEEITLADADHQQLYNELLIWAREFRSQQHAGQAIQAFK